MASPNSKATLKEYCLRQLGKPVIEINVDEDQVDDLIDDTIQIFQERVYDGVERKSECGSNLVHFLRIKNKSTCV